VLSQGEPRDADVNFDTYRILQQRRAVSLSQHGFLLYISDRSNAEIALSTVSSVCTEAQAWRQIFPGELRHFFPKNISRAPQNKLVIQPYQIVANTTN